ncbi:MAG: amidohydrolase [Rhodospirillaceae bacterium]|nr:amidohydrolase [Rhodospirillaceae bacterium]
MNAIDRASALKDEMISWRHRLHANPETAFEEFETAKFIAAQLESFGIEVDRGLATTGVVGVLTNGDGDTIGLRADMDALNIQELNTFTHCSKIDGKMHACGHDGHSAMLLGAAKLLAETRDFSGTVVLIFQPAEENEGGAGVMVNEGLFDKFPVKEIYGLHNWPSMPAGTMAVGPGPMMAAFDTFEITVQGRGVHAAMPHLGVDPVVAAAQIVTALQTVSSREADPQDACVLTVTQIHGGDTWNVIPDQVVLRGTTRWFNPELGGKLEGRIRDISSGVGMALGCSVENTYTQRYPATINTAQTASQCADVMAELIGEEKVERNPTPSMGAEDFAFMLQKKPGSYAWLGTGTDPDCPKLHNAHFDFNDDMLALGTAYWTRLAETLLKA